MKKKILAWLLCVVMVLTIAPMPTALAADGDPTTFVLSNEEGGLIDRLIAGGYGAGSLYDALVALEPASGSVISQNFLDALSNCPAGSDIFTQTVNDYAGLDVALAVNTDGTVFTTGIRGRTYNGQTGYSTYPASTTARESFTYADSAGYYIDAPNGGTTYKVFAIGWSSNQVPTFILSNEEDGLIDKLIAAGHEDDTLYEVLQLLQPVSGGSIPAGFMASLAALPADCEAKTAELSNFSSEFNNPIGIGADGNLIVAQIHGRDYYEDTDFTTTAGTITGVGNVQFTASDSESDYIDAGTLVFEGVTYYYKAFAIGWASNQVPTFMLSNEEGGLIDKLIAAGHGDDSLYEVLQLLQPVSGGAIPADFMAALAACPADCDAKTAVLSDFSDPSNNPIGIGADGNLIVAPIHGRDYYTDTDFTTSTGSVTGVGDVLFTAAESEGDYIDAGANTYGGVTYYYKTFAIGWSAYLTVAGTATDDTAILQIDNKTPSARDKTWELSVTSGTVKAGVAKADVTLSGLPAGLDYTAAKGTGNTIVITLTGAATAALTADATLTATIKGSAVTEADAQDSAGISLKLWYVGAGTTFVISNESGGYLIDKLIATGYDDDTMYEVLELLQPNFSGVITERFMKTLDSTPADGEVFTVALSNFAGLNGPVSINADGTLRINPIFGCDYDGDTGYTTTQSDLTGVGVVRLTTANSEVDYIDAGEIEQDGSDSFKAFAVAWMDTTATLPTVTTDTMNTSGVTQTTAAVSGNVTSAGTSSISARGFVYGTSANPTTADSTVTAALGTGTGAFSATLTNLTAGTEYHVRAYATSGVGTSYGSDMTFTTLAASAAPTITGISPSSGPEAGGTSVTITGTNFTGATAVKFGDSNATYSVNSATQIIAVAPAGTGTVHVTVTAPGGTSATSSTDRFTYTSNGGGGGGGGTTTPTYTADVKESGVKTDTLTVTVSGSIGAASLTAEKAEKLLDAGNAVISMPSVPGVTAYRLDLPASALTADEKGGALTLTTGFGSVTFPDNMLSSLTGADGKTAGITVSKGHASGLTDAEKAAIGTRPLIQLTLTLDGTQTAWSNPAAPVNVTIPYTPTAEELKNPESLIIWYLDGSGKLVCIQNGHYDAATGTVTFAITHFSKYAVGYNPVSFKDVADGAWYKKAVAFIGARGITTGTGNGNYSPDAKLTRGEFIVLLMRAYDIAPDANPTDNFADAGNTYYTNYLAAAKRLGISAGVGNNMYAPGREITRQEMFTLLYNALNVIGQLPQGNSGKTLADFSDAGNIASWAKDALTLLVKTGTVSGSDGKLSPTDTTTRAVMAQVLYNRLMK